MTVIPRQPSTRACRQPEFDRGQVASRQTDRAVGAVASGEHYLSHSQGVHSAAVVWPDVVSNGGYGARPKTTGSARQTESAWMEAGLMMLPSAAGIAFTKFQCRRGRASAAREANLGQPSPPNAVRACPQVRMDAPMGSTPVQSPAVCQDPSTGKLFQVPSMQLACHRSIRISPR